MSLCTLWSSNPQKLHCLTKNYSYPKKKANFKGQKECKDSKKANKRRAKKLKMGFLPYYCGVLLNQYFFFAVLTDYLLVRVHSEPVLKFNTGVLRCQVPQSAASYTKVISWTRGTTRLYPSSRGGNLTHCYFFHLQS